MANSGVIGCPIHPKVLDLWDEYTLAIAPFWKAYQAVLAKRPGKAKHHIDEEAYKEFCKETAPYMERWKAGVRELRAQGVVT